ncbi:hypothetical protein PROFUN_09042 [Planoprotostelium fungivorum]|uniref:Ubiquitin-like domain-containing protein n=1 Tax=Planoprotostelium fungivorum TaxID=1890364 RepID=A0A2P6MV84_9EUKA|nr:hypothetical protein PROFUN_09042 [Planoprotostelium fungivorum]
MSSFGSKLKLSLSAKPKDKSSDEPADDAPERLVKPHFSPLLQRASAQHAGRPASPSLDLSRNSSSSSFFEESDIFEEIPVTLELFDGRSLTKEVEIGETVLGLKRILYDLFHIPFDTITLYLDGKAMLDPLSLNDFPSIVEQNKAVIQVKVKPRDDEE